MVTTSTTEKNKKGLGFPSLKKINKKTKKRFLLLSLLALVLIYVKVCLQGDRECDERCLVAIYV